MGLVHDGTSSAAYYTGHGRYSSAGVELIDWILACMVVRVDRGRDIIPVVCQCTVECL